MWISKGWMHVAACSLTIAAALATSARASSVVTSSLGAGGPIPDGPCGDSGCDTGPVWSIVPTWPELTSTASVAQPLSHVTAITIFRLQHTWRGDVHAYLENPAGERFNVIVRPGSAGLIGDGDSGNFQLDTYVIVESGGASLAQGSVNIAGGTYDQYLNSGAGAWSNSVYLIANLPLHAISGNAGTWTLHVRDWYPFDHGSIEGWMLEGVRDDTDGFCFGDGAINFCPCNNNGAPRHGCANSFFPEGGFLAGFGTANVSADSIVFDAQGLTSSTCVFFQGSAVMDATPIDDGLGCVSGALIRIGAKPIVGGASTYPQSGDAPISVKGAVGARGGARYYQAFYRNSNPSFCTPATTNRTNGVIVNWGT